MEIPSFLLFSCNSIANQNGKYNGFMKLFPSLQRFQRKLAGKLEQGVPEHLLQGSSGGQGDAGVKQSDLRFQGKGNVCHGSLLQEEKFNLSYAGP